MNKYICIKAFELERHGFTLPGSPSIRNSKMYFLENTIYEVSDSSIVGFFKVKDMWGVISESTLMDYFVELSKYRNNQIDNII